MNVTPSTRRKALLGIYRIRRKRKGGRLAAKELERAWHPTTGLRRADLQLALLDLVEQKQLLKHETSGGLVFELTWLGEEEMRKLGSLADWLTLLRARMRRSKRDWLGHRRAGDAPAR